MKMPAPYKWPEGKKAAFCFSVDVDAHSPWMWNNRNDQPQLLSHLEQRHFGPRVGLPRIVEMLDRLGVKGSFFVPAAVAEKYPDMLPSLVEGGHEIGLHGYFHELVNQTSDEEFTRMLEASIALFEKQVGFKPAGFRSPAWEMTPHMVAEIRKHGFYDSSLMGYDTPYEVDQVTEVPVNWSTDDAIFFKFLGGAGFDMWPPVGTDRVLAAWTDELDALHDAGALFMLTIHDWISGRAPRTVMVEKLLQDVLSRSDLWVATVGEVAAHHEAENKGANEVGIDIPAPMFDHPAWKGE
ncbi:polysaccharide deacetylase family protein [Nitratireductor basaltis]|uniref:Chitooligosaccharide deacetylase n=1 Tax=Nitratireductor basaltis TaxID=472175 RepID=A0A084U571_9HYPH|nr:polysaccharide deacetylase [Nitratireductor basaltis]KFB08107.1 putative polysaccharide deacetylase [Nitratireductor basaltis]